MKDQAIQAALEKTEGKSFSYENMVVGISPDHVAIAFNDTPYNQNQIVALRQRDAQELFSLLYRAGQKQGWVV